MNLVIAKSRLAPSAGTTVPRMEMSSAVVLARLMLLVLRSFGFKAAEAVMALDSECSVAVLQKTDGLLQPYLAHRAVEVHKAVNEMKSLCKLVPPVLAVAGANNPADTAIRGLATAADISTES